MALSRFVVTAKVAIDPWATSPWAFRAASAMDQTGIQADLLVAEL